MCMTMTMKLLAITPNLKNTPTLILTPIAPHNHDPDPLDYTNLDPKVEVVDRLIVQVVVDVDDATAGQDGQVASHLSFSFWTISFLFLYLMIMKLQQSSPCSILI